VALRTDQESRRFCIDEQLGNRVRREPACVAVHDANDIVWLAGNLPKKAVRDLDVRSCAAPFPMSAAVPAMTSVATVMLFDRVTRSQLLSNGKEDSAALSRSSRTASRSSRVALLCVIMAFLILP
jgi:hypothetical protein